MKTSPANSSSKMTNFSIAAIMNSASSNGGRRRPSEDAKTFNNVGKLLIYRKWISIDFILNSYIISI